MGDKVFDLLEKMYIEFKSEINELKTGQKNLEAGQTKLEAGQTKLEMVLENDIKSKLQALHEREAANTEKLREHSESLVMINNKLDYLVMSINSHDKRLEVIEGSRKKKA